MNPSRSCLAGTRDAREERACRYRRFKVSSHHESSSTLQSSYDVCLQINYSEVSPENFLLVCFHSPKSSHYLVYVISGAI
jgi:hypothetical protein